MNSKIIVLFFVLFELHHLLNCFPQKRQRGLVLRNKTNSPVVPLNLKKSVTTTTPPPLTETPKTDTINDTVKNPKERDVPNENQPKIESLDCVVATTAVPKHDIEIQEHDLKDKIPDPHEGKPTEFLLGGHEYVELKSDSTEKPKETNELQSQQPCSPCPLGEQENKNAYPEYVRSLDKIFNETTNVKSNVGSTDSDLVEVVKTAGDLNNKTDNGTNVDKNVIENNDLLDGILARRFLIPMPNDGKTKSENSDANDDVVIKKNVVKEIIERRRYPYATRNSGNDKRKYHYTAKYVEGLENGGWQQWDLPTYTVDLNQPNQGLNYQINNGFIGPQDYIPYYDIQGYNVQNSFSQSPYDSVYRNGLNYQQSYPAYDNQIQYYNNDPVTTDYRRNQVSGTTKIDNQPVRLNPVWNTTPKGYPTSIVIPLEQVDLERLKTKDFKYRPDTSQVPPSYKYPFEESLDYLHLDDPNQGNLKVSNELSDWETSKYCNYPKNWYKRRCNVNQPRVFHKYDPHSKYYFTEVVMPTKNLERIWRSWHKTEIHKKGGKSKTFTDSDQKEYNREGKRSKSANRRRRIGAIESYSNNGNSKPWRSRLDYSPTTSKK